MTLDRLILWMVCFSCIAFFGRSLFVRRKQWGWVVVSGGILTVTVCLLAVAPQNAAWVGGLLWAVFLLLPVMGLRQINEWFQQERYDLASSLATVVALLHPADGWPQRVGVLRALATAYCGQFDRGLAQLEPYQNHQSSLGLHALALNYWLRSDWKGLLAWLRSPALRPRILPTSGQYDVNLAVYYLRALGETGQIEAMLSVFPPLSRVLQKTGDRERLNRIRLYVLAFCGETETLFHLFEGELSNYSSNSQQFWLATAQLAVGRQQTARKMLEILQETGNPVLQRAIAWRLQTPPPPTSLDNICARTLLQLKQQLAEERRYSHQATGKRTPGTWGLITLNLVAFYGEVRLGGSENIWVLYRLGALVPQDVLAGESWRLLAATFLHFGLAHLAMNMFGLYILGQFVESRLGFLRFLIAYLISGVGSMGVITLLSLYVEEQQFVVGASGAVMGLIGAIAAIFWQGWRQDKAQIAKERLRAIGFAIALQTIFDLSIPEICFLCHASGILLGFLTTTLLLSRKPSV